MRLFEDFKILFEQPDWSYDFQLCFIDTVLEMKPYLLKIFENDITKNRKKSRFGRKDVPSIEQIVRAAFYKKIKGLNYRQLFYHQIDSRICAAFLKIDANRPYSYQVYQKYISKISSDTLNRFMRELVKIAMEEGIEDMKRVRQDTTTVETNIHYPTDNSLIWDCIRKSTDLLKALSKEIDINYLNFTKGAHKVFYDINLSKKKDDKYELFCNELIIFEKVIHEVNKVIGMKSLCITPKSKKLMKQLENLYVQMNKIYDVTYRRQIEKEDVAVEDKILSIFEPHTDVISKGDREIKFGHKVNLATGRSNLILGCEVVRGNPSDKSMFQPMLEKLIKDYEVVPRDISTDGGFASFENLRAAKKLGIINIVFNKTVGSLKNQVTSKNMETRLKKWRSGMEAVISNLKRGYQLRRCKWKGWEHFKANVFWSVIAYNIGVISVYFIKRILKEEIEEVNVRAKSSYSMAV